MIWKHSKNDDLIISSEISPDAPAMKQSIFPMDSFGSQPLSAIHYIQLLD